MSQAISPCMNEAPSPASSSLKKRIISILAWQATGVQRVKTKGHSVKNLGYMRIEMTSSVVKMHHQGKQ